MTTLIRLELLRVLRNRRYVFFSLLYPAVLYLLMAGSAGGKDLAPGMPAATYFMVSMATFGSVGAALNGAMRIALERKEGWVRQLRLTALPGHGYVLAKLAAATSLSLPSILLVMLLGGLGEHVRMDAWQWPALVAALWIGSFVFAALGIALGYAAGPDVVQPVVMITYIGLSLLGGTWFSLDHSPTWIRDLGEVTPTGLYNQLGRIGQTGTAPGTGTLLGLAVYFLLFAGLAAWLYQRDTKQA
ncbi:ABC transporter permease [Peterkaempfera sp. SMS 1(5)a]|uniref:ABC transporter permease n=1 Tax=Peterkaempfera podocarpi TaxID=3232308 RepID=UPI00366A970C